MLNDPIKTNTHILFTAFVEPNDPIIDRRDPCDPNPCGEHAICIINSNTPNIASCQCRDDFLGNPPNCRPECQRNADCPLYLACSNGKKCIDPCQDGLCGSNTDCRVINHRPVCACLETFTGDPFASCSRIPGTSCYL
jgi:hypothetical protein